MTEFTNGIFKVVAGTSVGRALIYTLGNIIIAMTVMNSLGARRVMHGRQWYSHRGNA